MGCRGHLAPTLNEGHATIRLRYDTAHWRADSAATLLGMILTDDRVLQPAERDPID